MRKKLLLVTASFVSFIGASDPLNPLVIRNEAARAAVRADCDTSLTDAPMPRVDLREVPLPEPPPAVTMAPPPSGSLRKQLDAVQNALVRNDRPAFDAALAEAKATTNAHPPGGERRAAEELIRIYEGAQRLWDAQYRSPFFGEDTPEYAIASGHRGYADAIRNDTFTDDRGTRFYPAAESRAFLADVAASRAGGRAQTSSSRAARSLTTLRPKQTASRATPRPASTSRPTSTSRTTSRARPRKPAAVISASSSPNPSAPPTAAAVPEPAAPPVAESSTASTATASSPAAEDTPPATVESPPTETVPTDTALTAAPATTEPPAIPETRPMRERSVILPTILILAGLAVLVVLFRASK